MVTYQRPRSRSCYPWWSSSTRAIQSRSVDKGRVQMHRLIVLSDFELARSRPRAVR